MRERLIRSTVYISLIIIIRQYDMATYALERLAPIVGRISGRTPGYRSVFRLRLSAQLLNELSRSGSAI